MQNQGVLDVGDQDGIPGKIFPFSTALFSTDQRVRQTPGGYSIRRSIVRATRKNRRIEPEDINEMCDALKKCALHEPQSGDPNARERVLGTTELLEDILEYLSPTDIVVCERVCKTFQNCYKSSKSLQLGAFNEVRAKEPALAFRCPEAFRVTLNFSLVEGNTRRYRNHHRWMEANLRGISGIRKASLVVEIGQPVILNLALTHPRHGDGWKRASIGSWTKQYLTDPSLPMTVKIHAADEKIVEETLGETRAAVTAVASFQFPACQIGQLLKVARLVHGQLYRNIFNLPPTTGDLFANVLINNAEDRREHAENVFPLIQCTSTKQTARSKRN